MENNFQWILGKSIQSIHLKRDENYNDNIISIYLTIDNKTFVVSVDDETDTIVINSVIDKNNEYKEDLLFSQLFAGKKIVSFWQPINNLGYNDVFILGLDKFVPTHLFSVIASCITINIIKQIDN